MPAGYSFQEPACGGVDFICWPTVGASSVEYYGGHPEGIPGWDPVLLVSASSAGRSTLFRWTPPAAPPGAIAKEARTENRYRDTTVHPDGRTIYVATDSVAWPRRGGGVSKVGTAARSWRSPMPAIGDRRRRTSAGGDCWGESREPP